MQKEKFFSELLGDWLLTLKLSVLQEKLTWKGILVKYFSTWWVIVFVNAGDQGQHYATDILYR